MDWGYIWRYSLGVQRNFEFTLKNGRLEVQFNTFGILIIIYIGFKLCI